VVGAGEFGERVLRFDRPSGQSSPGTVMPAEDFLGVVGRIGHMPLPPYIRREQAREADLAEDRERYQTVYAQAVGSAAAPTAGLHFTTEILGALTAKGVEIATVTLHVGLGTFQPVRVSEVEDIRLHSERYTLPAATADALNRAMAEGRRVVAVGTTTTRVLEHVATEAESAEEVVASAQIPSVAKAPLQESMLMARLKSRPFKETAEVVLPAAARLMRFEAHSGATSIFIGPGHRFRVVGGLLTNFHLPESTLLMLVSAFAHPSEQVRRGPRGSAGREVVLDAYAHAVGEGYRFYSYGDCMLVV
jgi:S-adenosylmethionine:tRNA ribosyltransferase-isomerase